MGSCFLVDKSYVKLRSVVLGWDLPKRWLAKTPFQAVKVSAYGNNLFVWTPSSNTFIDPEMTSFGTTLKVTMENTRLIPAHVVSVST